MVNITWKTRCSDITWFTAIWNCGISRMVLSQCRSNKIFYCSHIVYSDYVGFRKISPCGRYWLTRCHQRAWLTSLFDRETSAVSSIDVQCIDLELAVHEMESRTPEALRDTNAALLQSFFTNFREWLRHIGRRPVPRRSTWTRVARFHVHFDLLRNRFSENPVFANFRGSARHCMSGCQRMTHQN